MAQDEDEMAEATASIEARERLGRVASQVRDITAGAARRAVRDGSRILANVMSLDLPNRTTAQHVAHAVTGAAMYLSLVDLPSVVGGTSPLFAAGQAALASTALANMMVYLNAAAFRLGAGEMTDMERRFRDWLGSRVLALVNWSLERINKSLRGAKTQQLEDVLRAVQDSEATNWGQLEDVQGLPLLLGIQDRREELPTGPPQDVERLSTPRHASPPTTPPGPPPPTPGGRRITIPEADRVLYMTNMQERATVPGTLKPRTG